MPSPLPDGSHNGLAKNRSVPNELGVVLMLP